jgi:hypothetical protein
VEFFKKYFDEVEEWNSEEVKVLCPFHSDSRPSASINTLKNLFHCWVCDIGFNEEQFIARVNNISSVDATKLLSRYEVKDKWEVSKGYLWSDELALNKVKNLGLSNDLIYELKLGLVKEEGTQRKYLGIPVYYNNILVDVRQYNLFKYDGQPKVKSNEGANTGWVLPYDKFLTSNNTCYFFEGEKDMLIAREVGLNAYTLTGGAGAKPNDYVINAFKDKDIVICYDNDDAGINGMNTFYSKIKDIAKQVRYIKIGDVVKENKEDFYDYIKKYDGNVFEFYTLEQHYFNLEETNEDKNITIKQALKDSKLNKKLKSVVTVTSEFADPYSVPSIIEMVKLKDGGTKNDTMFEGEKRTWFLEEKNMQEMLELIEVNAKNTEILSKVRTFLGIPSKEPFVDMVCKEPRTVFKSVISDKDNDGSGVNLDIYSFEKLNVGTQYVIEYRIYPHPTKHQKLIAVANKVKPIHDNNNYVTNIEKLSKFKSEGNIKERLNKLYESAKHHIAKHLDYDLWLMCDLVFNSILDFKYDEVMKGALDIFLLGDTRTGKSETTSKMTELYNFGHFLSLKTSTTVGLIGGSNKIDGSFCNTIGAIPRQHKRLVVLEEFSGARQDFIRTMTDIRSSDELRIARVSGELVVPCKLRMITISNPINDESGNPRFLETFPNGVMPLMELIKSAEDVARYDGFLLIPKIEHRFNPFAFKLNGEPIPKECYEEKANWVVTRGIDNVKFEDGVDSYIWEKAEELNKLFECNFPLFGTTTSKKLARFCVALASLVMNVDDTYEDIIVTKEIVDYTAEYLTKIYSNGAFKLNEYAEDYRSYSEYTDEDINDLQSIYANNSTFIDFISTQNRTTRSNLISISGLDGNKFAPVFNKMVAHKFIRLNNDNVYPTNKFRKVYNLIDKSFKTDVGNKVANSVGVTFVNDL